MGDSSREQEASNRRLVLIARKGKYGLPTACPLCLPVYLYLKLSNADFSLEFDTSFPDSDHIPYVEYGDCVAFNNEKGGVIETLKEEKILDLESKHPSLSIPDLVSTRAMINSCLHEAVNYELWVATDKDFAYKIYFSDLSPPMGTILYWKQTRSVKQLLGITKLNADEREEKIYKKANEAYDALSLRLGDQIFFFDNRPTDVDALFLGHALFVLYALPETSVLRSNLLRHDNLVKYTQHLKAELLDNINNNSVPRSQFDASTSSSSSSSRGKKASSGWSSPKPNKPKPKKERTEEEKKFRRRAKYFLGTQLIGVLVFLSLMGGSDTSELDDDDGVDYDDE